MGIEVEKPINYTINCTPHLKCINSLPYSNKTFVGTLTSFCTKIIYLRQQL